MAIIAIVAVGSYMSGSGASVASVEVPAQLKKTLRSDEQTSVNEVVATTIAANVAEATHSPVSRNVANRSISLSIEREMAASNSTESITKQEIVQPAGSRRDLIVHVVKAGEDTGKIAKQYGITKETVHWANKLTSDKVKKGKKLIIPPVDGVVYTVKAGDTPAKLAKKYKTSEARIVAFNDLELTRMKKGDKVILPAGRLPEDERPGFIYRPGSVGNRYAYGWCTWYAYERRPEIGSFWGDARNWAYSARQAGFTVVQGVPKAGAIFQYGAGGYGGGYGHVGIVESVDHKRGTMVISDMNGIAGFGQIGRDTVPINRSWSYIY